jgi:hypothetical protein
MINLRSKEVRTALKGVPEGAEVKLRISYVARPSG